MEPIKHYYELPDGSMISCTFYDSGGSVKYRSTIETFYKNVEGIVLIFDLTNKNSFDDVKDYFIPTIQQHCREDIPVLIIGNKKDMQDERLITYEEANEIAMKYDYCYKEVSCSENSNIVEVFKNIIQRTKSYIDNNNYQNNDAFILLEPNPNILVNYEDDNNNRRRHSCLRCC